jgi:hypothetical protein
MKTTKILNRLLICVTLITTIMSCIKEDDFNVPEIIVEEPIITGTETTFQAIVSAHQQAVEIGNTTIIFEEDIYITGYVVSSDHAGNFFEEIIIQNKIDGSDALENPRLGFRVSLNVSGLYQSYQFGRKVYVKLKGLTVGVGNGVYVIGKGEGSSVDQIQAYEYQNFIIRSAELVSITPKETTLENLKEADENTFIKLNDMQFIKNQLSYTYAGELFDEFDGFRILESCAESLAIRLQTSTFSDFKSIAVNGSRGAIQGVFSRDFRDEFNVLSINSPTDVLFDISERCDPVVLECDGAIANDIIIWKEDFESISNESELDALGWNNLNVSGGNERYEINSFSGDNYLKISASFTGENPLEAWLVSPAIDLDSSIEEELTFEVSSNFESGKVLTVFITENYTGDPLTTDWRALNANIPIGNQGFGDFEKSTINISCLNGDVRVAFKYLGGDGLEETRYHINDLKVTGK